MVNSSPECDFWVADASQYRWGLPILVPTCPKKMFMQGPRLKYIDIVTDTLHASSSDLITWNTLVMIKLKWFDLIPRKWLDITTHSLKAWEERDQLSQFHSDTRRGYARVTPVALSSVGVPGSGTLPQDEYPKHGLGIYGDYETCEDFKGYIWASWTTMAAQPMQVDSALQAMINQSAQMTSGQTGSSYDLGIPISVNPADQPMGSNEFACGEAAPFPESSEDVFMDSVVDKVTRRPKTIPEAKFLMWDVYQRMPAWKGDRLIEFYKNNHDDLEALGEATGILFESNEMMSEAVQCLERVREENEGKGDARSGAPKASDSHPSQSDDHEMSDDKRSNDREKKKESQAPSDGVASGTPEAADEGDTSKQDPKSSSKEPEGHRSTTRCNRIQQPAGYQEED